MTVIEIPSREPRVIQPRPALLTTPVLTNKEAAKETAIAAIDTDLDHLFCAAAAIAGCQDVPGEVVHSLQTLHARMKQNVETLYSLG